MGIAFKIESNKLRFLCRVDTRFVVAVLCSVCVCFNVT